MSFSIAYDRIGLKVGNKVVLLVCAGSSNCTEFYHGREVYERTWLSPHVNYDNGECLFTPAEWNEKIDAFCNDRPEGHAEIWKSHNTEFGREEYRRWLKNAVKHAVNMDKFIYANNFCIYIQPYKGRSLYDEGVYRYYPIDSKDFVEMYHKLLGKKLFMVTLDQRFRRKSL